MEGLKKSGMASAMARLVRANCIADVWRELCAEMEKLGLDMVLYGGSCLSINGVGRQEDTQILMHAPDEYAATFLGEKYYVKSVLFQWCAQNRSGFTTWKQALREIGVHPSPYATEMINLNASYGIEDGFFGSLGSVVPGASGVISLSNSTGMTEKDTDEIWAYSGDAIKLLCETFQLRFATLPQTGLFAPLTSRQLEVLYWYSEGKLVQDVATIMGISCGTVEKHMRMAREALDADTTAHAVRRATSLNLLTA